MGWHHFTDFCCAKCHDPSSGGKCHACECNLCSNCVEAEITEADFEDKTDERYKRKAAMRAERVKAAAKVGAASPTSGAASPTSGAASPTSGAASPTSGAAKDSSKDDAADIDSSEDDFEEEESEADYKKHQYCEECYNDGEVTDTELIAFLINASPYKSRTDAEDACLEHLLNAELDREEKLLAQESTAAGMAATAKAASEIVTALSPLFYAVVSPSTQQQQQSDRDAARLNVEQKAAASAEKTLPSAPIVTNTEATASTRGKRKHE